MNVNVEELFDNVHPKEMAPIQLKSKIYCSHFKQQRIIKDSFTGTLYIFS